ncbi:hypothetical protein T484DRAFT_1820627 [Baffinella frigidus]|nr:hypothetical protein T484DRAFT_1820627 [Cryptophyta sp. CCMP2293]
MPRSRLTALLAIWLLPCAAAFLTASIMRVRPRMRQSALTLSASTPPPQFSDNLGPAEKAQRSLDRDNGVGRVASVSNTVAKLLELRRRGLKYDGTPMSKDEKAADALKEMEKMMNEAEDFMGS